MAPDGDKVVGFDMILRIRSEADPMTRRPTAEPIPNPRKERPTIEVGQLY